jgi:hypothetical protein
VAHVLKNGGHAERNIGSWRECWLCPWWERCPHRDLKIAQQVALDIALTVNG